MWAVQLGSFGDQANANKLAADLRQQNFTAFLSKLSTSSGELHRVRIGPQKDRASAEAVAAQLLKAGHKGQWYRTRDLLESPPIPPRLQINRHL